MGPRIRLGSVADRKTRPVASGEFVIASASTASATWWRRSPNRLIACASQNAAKRASSARRTYGCRRRGRSALSVSAPDVPRTILPSTTGLSTLGEGGSTSCKHNRAFRAQAPVCRRANDENRNQTMPRAISASPMLATFASGPSGSGRTSPNGAGAQEQLDFAEVGGSGVWKEVFRSAVDIPTASREGTHTCIQPALTNTAMLLEATPRAMRVDLACPAGCGSTSRRRQAGQRRPT